MSDDLHGDGPGYSSVTLSAGGQSVTLTPDDFGRIAQNAERALDGEPVPAALDNVEGVEDLRPGDRYPLPTDTRFIDERGRQHDFLDAPDLEVIAATLFERHDMQIARYAGIRFLWKREQTATAMGKCIKASGPLKHATGVDWVIWLAADGPRAQGFTLRQVEALLYHELLHVGENEDGKPKARRHDAEIFRDELVAYGAWDRQLQFVFDGLSFPKLERAS